MKKIKATEIRKRPDLNQKQKKFIDYYIQTGNATESAKKAGYSEKNAYQVGYFLLKNPKIQTALQARLEDLSSERIAEDKEILEYLTAVMRGKIDDETIINIGIGKGCTEAQKVAQKVQSKERIKAAELLCKARGLFVNKSELEIQGNIPIVIKDDI